MFGWELPPYNSGGLGTATLGLTEGLAPLNIGIDLVLPKVFGPFPYDHINIVDAEQYDPPTDDLISELHLTELQKALIAQTLAYGGRMTLDDKKRLKIIYEKGELPVSPDQQATWYAHQAASIAQEKDFDIIHCHDWMTYYCGLAARKVAQMRGMNAPFIAQIHATEHDRCGDYGNPVITNIERAGLRGADRVVAVSHFTKRVVHEQYQVPLKNISVVHNGIPLHKTPTQFDFHELKKHKKIVLFMGRITMQKGPEYFIQLAKKVTDRDPNVLFVMVGSGDMEKKCIELSARYNLTGKILFSSFLRGKDVDRAYQLADLFVMPSVAEPFGIVALEAVQNGTPVLVSRQSGVAEVTQNMSVVNFWDIDHMANETLTVLHNHDLRNHRIHHGKKELENLTWGHSAAKLKQVYQEVIEEFQPKILQPAQIVI